jgi:multiple sugar transport system substrate-binding protein
MKRTRGWVGLVWVLVLGLLAAGCGGAGSGPQAGVLRVWTTWADGATSLQALFDGSNQPVKVTAGLDADRVLREMRGPTPPEVVVLGSSDLVGAYAAEGLLAPLDPWIDGAGIDLEDLYPAALAACQARDGTTLCLPLSCDVPALFWNKELFAAAGLDPERPPQTMEELVEYADRLTVRDAEGELIQVGFVPDLGPSQTALYARLLGGGWIDDEGTALTANSAPMVEALAWQQSFYDRYGASEVWKLVRSSDRYAASSHPAQAGRRLACQRCHGRPPGDGARLPEQGFYAGTVAMMVGGAWQVGPGTMAALRPGLAYGVAAFPPPAAHPERAGTATLEGAVALIPAGVGDKEAAAALLAWMVSPAVQAEAMAARSMLPASHTAAQDPRFQAWPHGDLFLDLLGGPGATRSVPTPVGAALNRALGEVEAEVLHAGGDPAALLDELQVELAPKLEEALAYDRGR